MRNKRFPSGLGGPIQSAMTWQRMALDGQEMWLAASEVIWRRSLAMALGTMPPDEAVRMVMEKPAAFAKAAVNAAITGGRGRGHAAVASAALAPISGCAKANARRLRRKRR